MKRADEAPRKGTKQILDGLEKHGVRRSGGAIKRAGAAADPAVTEDQPRHIGHGLFEADRLRLGALAGDRNVHSLEAATSAERAMVAKLG